MTETAPPARSPSAALSPALLPVYGAAIFLSAALLFAVQPMFTKMVLPRLGGSPSVWSVAMVFFQAALLLGYAYAHLLARTLTVGQGALVHLGVLGVAALTCDPLRLGAPAGTWRSVLADRAVHGLDRAAVLRALG